MYVNFVMIAVIKAYTQDATEAWRPLFGSLPTHQAFNKAAKPASRSYEPSCSRGDAPPKTVGSIALMNHDSD